MLLPLDSFDDLLVTCDASHDPLGRTAPQHANKCLL